MNVRIAATLAAFATVLTAAPAWSAATVLGSGLGYDCAVAALAGYADDDSVKTCTLALESAGLSARDRAGTYVNRGILHLRRKAYHQAHTDFETAIAIDPTLGEAFINRGAAFLAQHRFEEGLAEINHGLQLGAKEPEKAYYNRALAHEALGDLKSAYLDFREALRIKPGWSEPQRNLDRFAVRLQ